jgi:hypothetical protein
MLTLSRLLLIEYQYALPLTKLCSILYHLKQITSKNLIPCDDICTKLDVLYYIHCTAYVTCFS